MSAAEQKSTALAVNEIVDHYIRKEVIHGDSSRAELAKAIERHANLLDALDNRVAVGLRLYARRVYWDRGGGRKKVAC